MATFRTDDQQAVIRGLQHLGGSKGVTTEVLRRYTMIPGNVLHMVLQELFAEGVVEVSPHKNFLGGRKWRMVQK